jgi:neutral ceramidase
MIRVFLLLVACCAFAQEWKAGLSRAVITPAEPIRMAGFSARTKPSEGVRQDLYVKALALQYGAGSVAVIVTADTIGFTRAMSDEIVKRSGMPSRRLVLSASHTHSAPVAGQLGRPGYMLNEREAAAVRRYSASLIDNVVKVIAQATQDLQPASLSFGQGVAGFAVNRRRVRIRSLPGPVDQDVPVLAVRSPDGKLRAVVAGYACHATALSDYQISGDWPGFFKEEFERAHPGAEAMFVAGCGADSNALPRNTVDLARKYGQIFAAAVGEVVRGKMTAVSGPLETAFDTVDLPFAPPPSREQLQAQLKQSNAARRNGAARLLAILDRGGTLPDHYPYAVEVWQFGRALRWIVLSSEVVVDYSLRLKGQYGWNDTWVSAYANDFCGYIPSLRVLKEGGYEGGDAMITQGHPGPWGDHAEELIVAKVGELVKRVSPPASK